MPLSPWFPSGSKPRRAGVYRIRYRVATVTESHVDVVVEFAYWSRRLGWRNGGRTAREAMQRKHYGHRVAAPQWRGVLAPA